MHGAEGYGGDLCQAVGQYRLKKQQAWQLYPPKKQAVFGIFLHALELYVAKNGCTLCRLVEYT